MVNIVLSMIGNAIHMYFIRRMILLFTGKRECSRGKELVAYTAFWAINLGFFWGFKTAWVNAACSFVGIGLLTLMYTKNWKLCLFTTLSIDVMLTGCDVVTTLLFVDYQDGMTFNQIYVLLENLPVLACVRIAEIIVSHRQKKNIVQGLPLLAVPLCSILMLVFIYRWSEPEMLVVVAGGLLVINFFVLYLYDRLQKAFEERYQYEMLQRNMQIYAKQMEIVGQSQNKVRMLRHDMKHHLNELELLARQEQSVSVQNYIQDMRRFIENPKGWVESGNLQIDSVLNYFLQRAQKTLKVVETEIKIPQGMEHTFDMNVIFGNLLENAIEAAEQSEEKILRAKIKLRQGILRIEISNSFSGERHKVEGGYATTKQEAKRHGIGLKSVNEIVKKYNGEMETEIVDGQFYVNLILYMESEKPE